MGAWTMKCVGYDDRFQRDLYDRYPTWTPPESSKTRRKEKRTKGVKEEVKVEEVKEAVKTVKFKVKVKEEDGILAPTKASRGEKRKRAMTADSEATSASGKEAEVVDNEAKALMRIRKGTKSRARL